VSASRRAREAPSGAALALPPNESVVITSIAAVADLMRRLIDTSCVCLHTGKIVVTRYDCQEEPER
jgi:hypothetical protein